MSNWNIVNGSVEIERMSRLPIDQKNPIRGCPCCEELFNCNRQMFPYVVEDEDEKKDIVYECEYEKCEWRCPAEYERGSVEWIRLKEKRINWSRERLIEKEFPFPGKIKK